MNFLLLTVFGAYVGVLFRLLHRIRHIKELSNTLSEHVLFYRCNESVFHCRSDGVVRAGRRHGGNVSARNGQGTSTEERFSVPGRRRLGGVHALCAVCLQPRHRTLAQQPAAAGQLQSYLLVPFICMLSIRSIRKLHFLLDSSLKLRSLSDNSVKLRTLSDNSVSFMAYRIVP